MSAPQRPPSFPDADEGLLDEGHGEALDLLRRCATVDGFVATPVERTNYNRVWSRDGCIAGLAALRTRERDLVHATRATLLTLAKHAGPHGEIPSNVDVRTDRISLGGTAGRVDADLWWVVTSGQYFRETRDEKFLDAVCEPLEAVRRLLGCWEMNARGLIYVPMTGDWADEYVQNGYVLYDECLYLQAQREWLHLHQHLHRQEDRDLRAKATRLKHLIRANYWFDGEPGDALPDDVYHPVLYRKARRAVQHRQARYWMPFFCPVGYGYRFDTLANAMAGLCGVASDARQAEVDRFVEARLWHEESLLLPAFHPVIEPKDEGWDDLQMSFSHEFKNKPYEYHNGGRWPLVTGFYAADLARRGRLDAARAYLGAIHAANRRCQERSDEDGRWSFPEFLHGQTLVPGGTPSMAWSAAAAVLARFALEGELPFRREPSEV